jgi:arylsulfatase A-like enzyme
MPTVAELTGVALPRTELNGRSLVPVIRSADAPSPHEVLHWQVGQQWAVRQGDWKLLHNPIDPASSQKPELVDQRWFLANLASDPGERTNLAAQHPEIVERLRKHAPVGAK